MIQGFVTRHDPGSDRGRHRTATVFPHPTMSEAMHEAALDAYGRVIHI